MMTSVEWHLGGLAAVALLAAMFGFRRYQTPLNPLTMFAVMEIGLFTAFSGMITVMTPAALYGDEDIIRTIRISLIYTAAVAVPFLFHGPLLSKLFGTGLYLLGLNSDSNARRLSFAKMIWLGGATLLSFSALAGIGGGGLLWLTSPREAYQNYRIGAGPFFALTQWLLTFAMLYYIWAARPRGLKLLLTVFIFCAGISFLGSKNNILTLLVIGIAYYNFYVRRIRFHAFIIMMLLVISAIPILLVVQGSYDSIGETLLYFRDYFDTTTQFVARFDWFGFQHGRGWLSSLWAYVPRALYPDKPFEYGLILIHQVLFPDAAAMGYTPGLLSWTLDYLDFGFPGVLAGGLAAGVFKRMAYEYFLQNRQDYFAFVLGMHFAIWTVWMFAPLLLVVVLCLAQSIFLKLHWRRTVSNQSGVPSGLGLIRS